MSRKIVIDRFEGTYAICEDKDQKFLQLKLQNCRREQKKAMLLKSKMTVLFPLTRKKQTCVVKKQKIAK